MAPSTAQLVGRRIRTEIWDAKQRVVGLAVSNFAVHPALSAPLVVSSPNHNFHAAVSPCEVEDPRHVIFIMYSLKLRHVAMF